MKSPGKIKILFLLLLSFIISSCSKSPEPINYGSDECEYCRMQITDNKFAAEIVTDKSKIYKFDSIECLVGFSIVKNFIDDTKQSLYVNDYMNPASFIDLRKAFFTLNKEFRSPMGLNVQSFGTKTESDNFIKENGGNEINWNDVVQMVKDSEM